MSTDSFSPAAFPRLRGDARPGSRSIEAVGAEHERARVRGYADGHAEGFRAGNSAAAAAHEQAEAARIAREAADARAVADAVAALQTAARSLGEREREVIAASQAEVLGRAIELAEVIVARELADADASALSAVRRVLAVADPADVRELRLHPDDIATLQRLDAVPEAFALAADASLERGDAVATLAHGHIDARIGSALKRARRAVAEADA